MKKVFYSEEKCHSIWRGIIQMFKFKRKFNAERSHLIVKISGYEAFTKDCGICEYFVGTTTQKNQSILAETEQT